MNGRATLHVSPFSLTSAATTPSTYLWVMAFLKLSVPIFCSPSTYLIILHRVVFPLACPESRWSALGSLSVGGDHTTFRPFLNFTKRIRLSLEAFIFDRTRISLIQKSGSASLGTPNPSGSGKPNKSGGSCIRALHYFAEELWADNRADMLDSRLGEIKPHECKRHPCIRHDIQQPISRMERTLIHV